MDLLIQRQSHTGEFELDIKASDKSISHRSAMFALFANATCRVRHFLQAEDTMHTLSIGEKLGLQYEFDNDYLLMTPPKPMQTPSDTLYCGNSGTSMRLFIGLLSGASISATLSGDEYLNIRPMDRVINPLKDIGANIESKEITIDNKIRKVAPITIHSSQKLRGFNYESSISSAQVKSAMILAGMQASDISTYKEILLSRNHTENMILSFQRENILKLQSGHITITPACNEKPLNAFDIEIPNDPSSAFFFALLACITTNTRITLKRVMLNDTRIEAYKILEKMGSTITYENTTKGYENIGDITISGGNLKAIDIKENISWLIDEIPALSIAMAMAKGVSRIRNASELRVKESDRIKSTIEGLRAFGIETVEYEDGFDIIGGKLTHGEVDSKGDHRIAMSFAIASVICGGRINNCDCINTSFPTFLNTLQHFTQVSIIN